MAVNKQGRQLPTWYLDKVNMASEVWAGSPQSVHRGMPIVSPDSGGQGVTVQRHGLMAREQTNVKLTGPKIGRRLARG